MLPRSVGDREWYVCRTRAETHGPEACPMPVLDRAAVDSLALEMFQARCLEVDATKARLEAQLDAGSGLPGPRPSAPQARPSGLSRRWTGPPADYREGELGPRACSRQVEAQGAALEAAQAEQIAAAAAGLDTKSETLRRLAGLRDAVAERMAGAGSDVRAVRRPGRRL